MTFCMQLIHQSQWKSRRQFIYRSSCEIPLIHDMYRKFGLNIDKLDMDNDI